MRSYIFIVAGIIYLTVVLIGFHSCSLNACLGVKCSNGTCVDGKCNCNSGVYGPSCDTIIRNRFLGNFDVASSCLTGVVYKTQIGYVSKSDYAHVTIENMDNLRMTVTANIVGILKLTIPAQTDTAGGQIYTISGSGERSANHDTVILTVYYNNTINKITDTCTETYSRY